MAEPSPLCVGCGAPLPGGALFCGECGRPVDSVPPAGALERCEQCGAGLLPDDIFCGECGHVAGSITRAYTAGHDTVVIAPIAPQEQLEASDRRRRIEESSRHGDDRPTTVPDVRTSLSERMRTPHTVDEPEPVAADRADVETTRIGPARGRGDRFVLQFSTGESVTVHGTGLIGRNPVPEPGEYVDQMVRVVDPTRSVSKTHLEFGQDGGAFWVRDRYSGNGTILREPDSSPVRCDPAKRYPVSRGGRLDMGDQFVVVS